MNAKTHDPPHFCIDIQRLLRRDDFPLAYFPRFREFGIHYLDGGTSFQLLEFCPWCGERLPSSLQDRWLEEMKGLGLDPDDESRIPPPYLTDAWWREE